MVPLTAIYNFSNASKIYCYLKKEEDTSKGSYIAKRSLENKKTDKVNAKYETWKVEIVLQNISILSPYEMKT